MAVRRVRKQWAHRLFSRLAIQLGEITPAFPAQLLCPLCLRPFFETSIDVIPPGLTKEHIISRELSGKRATLTCKDCNSTHGHEIDAHLIQMLRALDSFTGVGTKPFRGRIEVMGLTVPSDVEWKASIGEMTKFRLRQFKPSVHEAIRQHFRAGDVKSIKVNFSFDYIPVRAYLGVLRIAYLIMFQEFGYHYILSPAANVIREMLVGFANPPPEIDRMTIEIREANPLPEEPWQLYSVEGGVAVMIVITLTADTKRRYAAFMPSPALPADQVLSVICGAAQNAVSKQKSA